MLHLLTDEHREKIVTEYRKRVAIVSLLGVFLVCVICAIFVLPTFFISHGKYSTVLVEQKVLDSELATKEEEGSSESIKNIVLSIEALRIFDKTKTPSSILNGVVSARPAGVQVRSLVFTPGEDLAMTIDLAGRADTRKSLVQFDQKLKANPLFEEVIIPLGNFAKEKNIDFSIKIIVSTSTASITPATLTGAEASTSSTGIVTASSTTKPNEKQN